MWDFIITMGSLFLGAWFVLIAPLLKKIRESGYRWTKVREEIKPRFKPVETAAANAAVETEQEKFDRLLAEMVSLGTGTPPSTSSPSVPTDTTGTPDTKAENEGYQRVLDLVTQGYSGNQICSLVGGKRADVLAMVKRARIELGVTK